MDSVLRRNFLIFIGLLLVSAGLLVYNLYFGEGELSKTDELVDHTHEIILEAEQLSTLIEGTLAAQRGYLLTGDEGFLKKYENKKVGISETVARLSELTVDNESQQSRLNEIRDYASGFTQKLEERATRFEPKVDKTFLNDVEIINGLRDNLMRVNAAVLSEEYSLLNERVRALERKKQQYLKTLIIGIAIGTIVLLVFNGILLFAQTKRIRIEKNLQAAEDRFALAIDGTQDGIFDWDIETNKVHYSAQLFAMLGHERTSVKGAIEDLRSLIHPDDVEKAWEYLNQYINGGLSEYTQEYRVKHKSGRWVWIQSRGKALFNKEGKAYRMVAAHTDISPSKQAQEKLESEKSRAESENRAKTEFLAHMSHEIRTPLTAISGIAEIMEKRQSNLDDKQKQLMKTLLTSSAALKDLVNDILDFSKIESGELELHSEEFDLSEIFEGVISIMALRASEKGISFVFDYSEVKDTGFLGDKLRLRQILINLAGNAIKFTDQGGVTIKAYMEDREKTDFLRVEVTDTGIGISPENFDMVFERFKQADSSVSRKYGGTGLGLPISRNLARLMSGDIFISSETGKGSTFTLLLPFKNQVCKPGSLAEMEVSRKLSDRIKSLVSDENRILIVEDYEGNVVVIGYIMEDMGISFDVASTGKQALSLWQKNHYDMILMDVQMPEMDGFTATREIRRIESEKNIPRTPIVGMTAHALVGDKDKCIEAGMDAYLPKPIVEADLKREILSYLSRNKKAA